MVIKFLSALLLLLPSLGAAQHEFWHQPPQFKSSAPLDFDVRGKDIERVRLLISNAGGITLRDMTRDGENWSVTLDAHELPVPIQYSIQLRYTDGTVRESRSYQVSPQLDPEEAARQSELSNHASQLEARIKQLQQSIRSLQGVEARVLARDRVEQSRQAKNDLTEAKRELNSARQQLLKAADKEREVPTTAGRKVQQARAWFLAEQSKIWGDLQ